VAARAVAPIVRALALSSMVRLWKVLPTADHLGASSSLEAKTLKPMRNFYFSPTFILMPETLEA